MYQHTSYKGPQNGCKIMLIICVSMVALYAILKTEFFPMMIYVIGSVAFATMCAVTVFYAISKIEKH